MNKLLSVTAILLIAFCSNAYGQIWYPRACRTVTTMPNFQPERFVGTWFEQSRYEYTTPGGDCNQVQLTAIDNTNNEYYIVNNTLRLTNNTEVNRGGFAQFLPAPVPPATDPLPNSFNILFNATVHNVTNSFQVIFTNYDSIAILFNCNVAANNTIDVPASEEYAWIMTREQEPSIEANFTIAQFNSIFFEPARMRLTQQHPDRCGAAQLYGGILFALIVAIVQLVK